ncbi:type II toxin-antitoxin system RelE/ParE family toxin [Cognatishimia sp. 1_MG-2023]|uniref:type II toxin-antitoxin system RelE/ParE family toxin n=1 Tax=Cognatishimia sp. 1_MG-2023 TaxID=3062642 RepID=UPI0026E2A803|nr:type II toxin-antitoxin system RelE/ParE family toxin [Cognatishimia sp. 1_MG-2023]MDO6728264.1 type II toxin-antitoxin system RelE/ParE family toxin [Cognatishimia sp. 1_MG-2023]
MGWTLNFSADAETDFACIFDHLVESYTAFGEPLESAFQHAENRIWQIREDANRILTAPQRGELQNDILPGCRKLTLGSASFWFVLHDTEQTVQILAIFFGGQDTRRRMLLRLLE